MKVKVCGLKYPDNLAPVSKLGVDMIGFNFYSESKRFVTEGSISQTFLDSLPSTLQRVGVFVNADLAYLKRQQEAYSLACLQLHGDEDLEYMKAAQKIAPVIKVFRIDENFDFESTASFKEAELFLFDTYTKNYGGSGERFDWEKLNSYKGETPFLLAGGITASDAIALNKIDHPKFLGIDINSGFETEPGRKDPALISTFLDQLTTQL